MRGPPHLLTPEAIFHLTLFGVYGTLAVQQSRLGDIFGSCGRQNPSPHSKDVHVLISRNCKCVKQRDVGKQGCRWHCGHSSAYLETGEVIPNHPGGPNVITHRSLKVEEGSRRGQSGDMRKMAPARWPTFEDRGRGHEEGNADRSQRHTWSLSCSPRGPSPGDSLTFAQ